MSKLNFIFRSVAGLLLLSASISRAQVTNTPSIDVYDGFETTDLSKVWDTDRFVPGAVEMQTNIFRAGHGAAKITVHAKDKFEAGINGDSDSERAELLEARKLTSKENAACEFSFSMFIPTNFPIVPTRLVAGLFYVATLSPLLGFIMLYTFRYTYVADHYQYVACIGPLALAAAGITTALNRVESRKGLLQPICCAALLLTLGVLTWQQAGLYHDRGTLWRDTLKKNPQCWMAENNLGNFLAQQGNTGEAMNYYQRALEIKPDYAEAHYNLADAFARQNQPDFAIEHLEAAVRINPQYVKARNNLGVALLGAGRLDEAVSQFERVLELNPRSIATRVNLAVALNKQGRLDAAIASVQRAVALDPNDVQARKYLSTLQDMKSQSTNSETR
jgi:tetratricopeptide (TPR) repeat protein